jgi:hypothetical protein
MACGDQLYQDRARRAALALPPTHNAIKPVIAHMMAFGMGERAVLSTGQCYGYMPIHGSIIRYRAVGLMPLGWL